MSADFGPVDLWPVRWPTPCDVSVASPTATGMAVRAATNILWARTAQRFGTSTVKLRPCRRTCRPTSFPGYLWDPWPGAYGGLSPYYRGWGVIDAGCGGCATGCGCSSLQEIALPAIVNSIVEVRVDGVVLTGSGYRVDNNRLLVRTDGGTWPYCQNLRLDDTQPGTLSVTAKFGEDVPADAPWAVGELACEFLKADRGDDCMLPRNVTNLVRQGVSITLPDVSTLFKESRLLGLRLSDLFISTWNPNGLTARPRAFSVDDALVRRAGT